MQKNLSVTKSNYLIEANYQLPTQAQKLILACLAKVDPRSDIPKEVTLTAIEFSKLMGVSNSRRDLYKAADCLFDAVIFLKNEDGDEIKLRWIQKSIKKFKGSGKITLEWSDDVMKYISSLKRCFTTYKLKDIGNLQSFHSMRLYELIARFKDTGERTISVTDFKFALGISKKYPLFKDLNKRVIKASIHELNQVTNLNITYEQIKTGRMVQFLCFKFNCED